MDIAEQNYILSGIKALTYLRNSIDGEFVWSPETNNEVIFPGEDVIRSENMYWNTIKRRYTEVIFRKICLGYYDKATDTLIEIIKKVGSIKRLSEKYELYKVTLHKEITDKIKTIIDDEIEKLTVYKNLMEMDIYEKMLLMAKE